MACQVCNSNRIASIYGKCNDLCIINIGVAEYEGYVPDDMNIGGGDDISIDLCLDCGHVNGDWPLPTTDIEKKFNKSINKVAPSWDPDPIYAPYLTNLKYWVSNNPNVGTTTTLGMLLSHDDDPDRIISSIIYLKLDKSTEFVADCIVDALYEWEYYDRLKQELRKLWPDDDEDDD